MINYDLINIAFLIVLVITNLLNYYMIRDIIWSIVWCDKGGKYNSLKKLKRNKSYFQKISMRYLEEYTDVHRKNYRFWIKFKLGFEIVEFVFLLAYFVCIMLDNSIYCKILKIVIILQSFLMSVILIMQSDINRNTKYDRLRK